MSKKNSRKSRNKKKFGNKIQIHVAKKIQEPWVQDIERCIRENLAAIRHDINPKYADCINNELLINYYVDKYSINHGPGSSLNEDAKKSIAKHMSGMEHVVKKIQEPWVKDILWCIRENLTAIRDDVNPKYSDDIDNPQKVQNIINYYVE